jgi:hypothetical protein
MILIGIDRDGVVQLCVSIDEHQLQNTKERYPDWILQEQVGEESLGWTFDGVTFTPPVE